jgi:hypothetical protein
VSSSHDTQQQQQWGTVAASRYACLSQIAVEQRKAAALRAAIADCDYQLKRRHLTSLLTVPDALVPKVVPPSLAGRLTAGGGGSPSTLLYPSGGDDANNNNSSDAAADKRKMARRGELTQTQQRKSAREEQRQSALKMSLQLSATVSDIVHCTNIFTDIVFDEKIVAGLQKEVRQRTDLLEKLAKWRHMVDRARAVNVDLK